MSGFAFGDPVIALATVVPVYVKAHNERREAPAHYGGFVTVHQDGPLQYRPNDHTRSYPTLDVDEHGIPGLPLPDPSELPTKRGVYRMLRRFPFDEPRRGVVVGRTRRQEGTYHEGRESQSYYGDGEWEPASLGVTRTVDVVQVALDQGVVNGHPWPARIVLVLSADLR